MLITVVFIGLIYALPNFYGEDPVIKIIPIKENTVTKPLLHQIENILNKEKIIPKSITVEKENIIIRFYSIDAQIKTRDKIIQKLQDKCLIYLKIIPNIPSWLSILHAKPMKLGLDLRGGTFYLIEIDNAIFLKKLQEKNIENILNDSKVKKINILKIINENDCNIIHILFHDNFSRNQALDYFRQKYPNLIFFSQGKNKVSIAIKESYKKEVQEYAIQKNIKTLRNRINQIGIIEPIIQRYGSNQIIVELPGIQDSARAKTILGATATLEFLLVNDNIEDLSNIQPEHAQDRFLIKLTSDNLPIVVYKKSILTGDHIIDSTCSLDEYNQPQVNIYLDREGGKIMSEFTKYNIGKSLATLYIEYKQKEKDDKSNNFYTVKEEKIINIANIQSRLSNHFRITGIKNLHEAQKLSFLLRSGTLMAPIKIVKECTVGSTMGVQNIKRGKAVCISAFFISVIFMIVLYKTFGFIAIIALIVNLILLLGIMSVLPGATLTMPGMAGIVLTLAIAVDANVLINERIKEEIRNGFSMKAAIYKGYKGAFSSILDANITTLITILSLYIIGTGAIKGFSVTTGIGIVTSMFTAIFCTRIMVDLLYSRKIKVKYLSI